MKKKNLKLSFNKETIARLQMTEINGGVYLTINCPITIQPLPEPGSNLCIPATGKSACQTQCWDCTSGNDNLC